MEFQGNLPNKLPQVGTTIFTTMSALAAETNAVNLSQGFPDFQVNPRLVEMVNKAMRIGHNQYAPMPGVRVLRDVIQRKVKRLYNADFDVDQEITITAGGTQGLTTTILSTIREGDEVILFTPAYDSYAPIIELAGGSPVYVQLKHPTYLPDWDEFKQVVNHRTRMVIINTPHNPTGAVWSKEDFDMLATILNGTNIMVISDEVYEHIVFDGHQHHSVLSHPELQHRSFAVFSFGKTFHATGWKLGYVIAPANLMAEFRKVHQYEVFSVNAPLQYALAEYMQDDKVFEIAEMYQQKRDFFHNLMANTKFKPIPSFGTYFQLYDYSALSDENDVDYAMRLTREAGVATIPISVFFNVPRQDKVLRFCFAKSESTLAEGAKRLHSWSNA
jgi:methionine aminotransferase